MTEELFRADAYARGCESEIVGVDELGLRLDRTVFYPQGGGQPGDTGKLTLGDGPVLTIVDTRKAAESGEIIHVPDRACSQDLVGQRVTAEIDWDRRHALMRIHTLLHLLCAAVPGGVTGGSIRDGSGRLDFDLPDTSLDKHQITAELNRLIDEDHAVAPRWISDDELASQPNLVRTMSVKPPAGQGRVRLLEIDGVDLQPCGGTHVASTGEIGPVRVTKIENKGRHNRRISVAFA